MYFLDSSLAAALNGRMRTTQSIGAEIRVSSPASQNASKLWSTFSARNNGRKYLTSTSPMKIIAITAAKYLVGDHKDV